MVTNNIEYKSNKKISFLPTNIRNYIKPMDKDSIKKQHLPATKEWPDSVYNFNKHSIKNLPVKDFMADRLIKNYFYLVKINKHKARSRRMRNLLTKLKTNRLYLSKPEIKQTNDKNVITIYNYDREKESLIKSFFYYKKLLRVSIRNVLPLTRKAKLLKKRLLLRYLPLTGRKLRLEIKLHEEKLFNKINIHKKNKEKNSFFKYLFFKWIFSYFDFKIDIFTPKPKTSKTDGFIVVSSNKHFTSYQQQIMINLGFIYKSKKSMNILFKNYSNKNLEYSNNFILNCRSLTNIEDKNIILHSVLEKLLNLNGLNSSYKISHIYRWYRKMHYKNFLRILVLRKIRLDRLRIFYSNNVRINKYIAILKLFLSKLYSKKIEINLINIKYPYLNSDIFVNSLTTKLRDRTRSLTGVVKRYLAMIKLVRLPLISRENVNKYKIKHNFVFRKKNAIAKSIVNLSNIKSKWITGMRLETAGRLTNRYVAERAIYRYKYRGNLKNIEYKSKNVRTYISPNLQKSYVNSIRRIGAFGIKGWISSN